MPKLYSSMVMALVVVLIASAAALACSGTGGEESQSANAAQDGAASSANTALPTIRLARVFREMTFERPILLTHAGDGSGRIFIVEQRGTIKVFDPKNQGTDAATFLDIRSKVFRGHNEEGLLALAFHPKYEENGEFFVYYSARDPRRGVVSRFTVKTDNPNEADAASEEVIMDVAQPWGNHNGCMLAFGPDGYLYISLGDGGAANDPQNNAQDLSNLLGTILRIDIDREDEGKKYAVPTDNPFVNREGARGEIWAYGLRNVWRMSFDRETGDLWAGDVGQNRWEEIDLITKGGNYGWRIREGSHPFRPEETSEDPLIDPIVEYTRREGISITGGYVYRGAAQNTLKGIYFYGDYASGRIWGLRYEKGEILAHGEVLKSNTRPVIASFGEDEDGELYICAFERVDGGGGIIYRIEQLF